MLLDSATIDHLDGQIIRCLQLAPRIPFRAAAEILDVSEQTVARRYRRLVKDRIVQVTAVLRPTALGQSNWIVRTQCKPSGSLALARALAQRDDISWVTLAAGGSEIVCVLRARTSEARDDLLMQRLPRTAPVLGMSAVMVLHRFVSADMHVSVDWSALADLLEPSQQDAVLAQSDIPVPIDGADVTLSAEDIAMFDVLIRDGRASYAMIAKAAGVSESRATRRLRALLDLGAGYFDVDISVAALGYRTSASLWLAVTPAELHRAGTALVGAAQVAFAAAITGPQNLTASVVCRDVDDLYAVVTQTVGSIPGVQSIEVSPVLRHVKQAGTLTEGDRLAATPPPKPARPPN